MLSRVGGSSLIGINLIYKIGRIKAKGILGKESTIIHVNQEECLALLCLDDIHAFVMCSVMITDWSSF